MAELNVLSIPGKMIDPKNRNVVGAANGISVIAYNQKLISGEKVPNRWEDFLKPEFKGKKFIVEIRPVGLASLAAGLGEEWVRDYARKLKEQDPIWARGHTRVLSAMIAGEYSLHQQVNYHSCTGARRKDRTNSLVCKVIEPVPVRISEREAVVETAPHPYAGLLWLEFLATPTAQKIIDDHEPVQSSIYAPGSELEKVTRGKKVSVNDWATFHKTPEWYRMIVEAFGFPKEDSRQK
jgi:ABC-type Fe3+ transport system substrate-binding protein